MANYLKSMSTPMKVGLVVGAAAVGYLAFSYLTAKPAHADPKPSPIPPGPSPAALPPRPGPTPAPAPSPSQGGSGDVCLKESGGALGTYQAQALLTSLSQRWGDASLNPKGVDGTMGNNTRSAIKAFQAAGDQPATGLFDPATAGNLKHIWSQYGGPNIILPKNPSANDVKTVAVLDNLRAAWGVAGSGGGSA